MVELANPFEKDAVPVVKLDHETPGEKKVKIKKYLKPPPSNGTNGNYFITFPQGFLGPTDSNPFQGGSIPFNSIVNPSLPSTEREDRCERTPKHLRFEGL